MVVTTGQRVLTVSLTLCHSSTAMMESALFLWSWWTVLEAAGYIMATSGSVLMSKWKPDKVGSRVLFNGLRSLHAQAYCW